jgi:beta-N-acetylhexosaminidase
LAIDEEGCTVKRLAADTFGCAPTLKDQPPQASFEAFEQRGTLLHQVGANLNFGVVADITADPQSFIFPRVFGSDPQATGQRVAEAVRGSQASKVLITLKHFPGHGETVVNSHTAIPQVSVDYDRWSQTDALPFVSGIKAGADVVMFGHLTYTAVDSVPATLSPKWHDILRQQLGFTGLTITDDMIMLQQSGDPAYADPVQNAIKALQAGNTMLLWVTDHGQNQSQVDVNGLIDGIVAAIQDGRLSETAIDHDVEQVLSMRSRLVKSN